MIIYTLKPNCWYVQKGSTKPETTEGGSDCERGFQTSGTGEWRLTGYSSFWRWIWNLFHDWERIFNIFTGAEHDRVKIFQNPVSRVKQTPHSTSKHWIFICERYHFYPMDTIRYFTAEHVINITLVVKGTDFYSFVKNLRRKNDPRCKL